MHDVSSFVVFLFECTLIVDVHFKISGVNLLTHGHLYHRKKMLGPYLMVLEC